MVIYPDNIGDITEAERFLERMRQTPSLLPNMSIYEAEERAPEHFDEMMPHYARQLDTSVFRLWVLTTDFGPLERAIKRCTLLPQVAETFARELPGIIKRHYELFPPQH